MVRFNLPVEQPVFLNLCVTIHSPNQSESVFSTLVRFVSENGRCWTAVNLNVTPEKEEAKNKLNFLTKQHFKGRLLKQIVLQVTPPTCANKY